MKQYTDNLYDDDLTVETDDYEYDDSYSREGVDLFEFSTDDESPISYLKSLILSIDWEITDEVLLAFNAELEVLRSLWAGESINLVYIQALEKLSKYIYHKKADSHPNAIKLLLTLYYNLEKIVSTGDMSDKQKKMILLEDVKRFEGLKRQISQNAHDLDAPESGTKLEQHTEPAISGGVEFATESAPGETVLLNLKAIVLGIDWEITDQDLNRLREEVIRLEELFVDSKPKLILLQGIGTLGAYIKLKKSEAHADAFPLLHTLYSSLEKIVKTPMRLEEEKAILFPAVESFNSFKALVGHTIAETVNRKSPVEQDVELPAATNEVAPAFADISDDEARGFQAEEEARALGLTEDDHVGAHVEDFFAEDENKVMDTADFSAGTVERKPAAQEIVDHGNENAEMSPSVAKHIALQGIDVEEDDDSAVVDIDDIAPALSDALQETGEVVAFAIDDRESAVEADDQENGGQVVSSAKSIANTAADGEEEPITAADRDIALQGVEVETEADDDSGEESLPTSGGELAPALAENDEISFFNAENLENLTVEAGIEEEILQNIEGLFDAAEDSLPSDAINIDKVHGASDITNGSLTPGKAEGFSQTDEAEQQVPEVDRMIDSFFDVDEKVTENGDKLIETAPEKPVAATVSVQSPSAEEPDEEEVVFELVEDDESCDDMQIPLDLDGAHAGILDSLRENVKSLREGFDSRLPMEIFEQLSRLRQRWEANPLERSFLQLLSTVIQHIDKHGRDAEGESYDLLDFICDALGREQQGPVSTSKQELLLVAMTKVLDWQQGLLARR